MTPAPPPEDLERARSEAWEQGTWSERLARWRGWMAKVNHHPDTVAAQLADYERDNIALLARVAALEGERERLRSAYQDYRQRSERLVWDSIRYGGRTADETIAELERVVAKASRAEAAEAKASALEGERDDLYRRLNEASGWKDGYKLRVRALEAELAGLRGAVELTVLHFKRNRDSGNFQGDDEHEAWAALNAALDRLATGTARGEGESVAIRRTLINGLLEDVGGLFILANKGKALTDEQTDMARRWFQRLDDALSGRGGGC